MKYSFAAIMMVVLVVESGLFATIRFRIDRLFTSNGETE